MQNRDQHRRFKTSSRGHTARSFPDTPLARLTRCRIREATMRAKRQGRLPRPVAAASTLPVEKKPIV